MKKPLLDVIFASEKRKNVLLLLKNGEQKMETLLNLLDTTRQSLLPQVRILENHHLVTGSDDVYQLTTLGKLIVDEIVPLSGTIDVLDTDIKYWAQHDLKFIPEYLLKRIRELNPYEIYEPYITEINQPNKELIETTTSSKQMFAVTNIFHPNFMDMFTQWAENNVEIHMVLSQNFFNKLVEHNRNAFQQLLNNKHYYFYLYEKTFHSLYFAVNDYMVLLAMLRTDIIFDERPIISNSKSALQWTKELFDYYLKRSTLVIEI